MLPMLLNTVDHSTTMRKMYSLCSDCNTELMSLNFYETMGAMFVLASYTAVDMAREVQSLLRLFNV